MLRVAGAVRALLPLLGCMVCLSSTAEEQTIPDDVHGDARRLVLKGAEVKGLRVKYVISNTWPFDATAKQEELEKCGIGFAQGFVLGDLEVHVTCARFPDAAAAQRAAELSMLNLANPPEKALWGKECKEPGWDSVWSAQSAFTTFVLLRAGPVCAQVLVKPEKVDVAVVEVEKDYQARRDAAMLVLKAIVAKSKEEVKKKEP